MWNGSLPDRSAQQQIKRQAILRAAAQVFSRHGSHGATLDDVASSLGVSKAALYRYVPNKNDLIFACQEVGLEIGEGALNRGEREGRNALESIRIGLRLYLVEMIEALGVPTLILEDGALTGAPAVEIKRRRDAYESRMRSLVRAGQADGSIIAVEPKVAVFMLLGSIHWVTKWYRPDGSWSAELVADSIVELATRALDTNPASGFPRELPETFAGASATPIPEA